MRVKIDKFYQNSTQIIGGTVTTTFTVGKNTYIDEQALD